MAVGGILLLKSASTEYRKGAELVHVDEAIVGHGIVRGKQERWFAAEEIRYMMWLGVRWRVFGVDSCNSLG